MSRNPNREQLTRSLDVNAQVASEFARLGHLARLPRQHDARVGNGVRPAAECREGEHDGERAGSARGSASGSKQLGWTRTSATSGSGLSWSRVIGDGRGVLVDGLMVESGERHAGLTFAVATRA